MHKHPEVGSLTPARGSLFAAEASTGKVWPTVAMHPSSGTFVTAYRSRFTDPLSLQPSAVGSVAWGGLEGWAGQGQNRLQSSDSHFWFWSPDSLSIEVKSRLWGN